MGDCGAEGRVGDRMDLIQGVVSDLRVDEAAREAVFRLADHTVRFKTRRTTVLRDGDRLAVWVRRRGDDWHAAAYRNITRGVIGFPPGLVARPVIGLFAVGGGGYCLEGLYTGRIGPDLGALPFALALLAAGVALVTGLVLMLDGARWSARIRAL
jgi:hypothetical protein